MQNIVTSQSKACSTGNSMPSLLISHLCFQSQGLWAAEKAQWGGNHQLCQPLYCENEDTEAPGGNGLWDLLVRCDM